MTEWKPNQNKKAKDYYQQVDEEEETVKTADKNAPAVKLAVAGGKVKVNKLEAIQNFKER